MMTRTSLTLFILAFLVVTHARCVQARPKKRADTGTSTASTMVLGYDRHCWQEDKLLAKVSMVPMICDETPCPSVGQAITLRRSESMKLHLTALAERAGSFAGGGGSFLVVEVCADRNQNDRCDEKPVAQLLRLNGKYLPQLYPDGWLTLKFRPALMKSTGTCHIF